MNIIRLDFNDRVEDVERYYSLLENILIEDASLFFATNGRVEKINVDLAATLKSSLVLMLYNLVESTMSNCLEILHDSFNGKGLRYSELTEPLQLLWMKHQYNVINKFEVDTSDKVNYFKNLVETIAVNREVDLTYTELNKYKSGSLFSGNLDDQLICKIAAKYGLQFEEECRELRSIRGKRNKLAHGELSFRECCNQEPIQKLKVLKDRTVVFLEKLIEAVEDYVSDSKYKR